MAKNQHIKKPNIQPYELLNILQVLRVEYDRITRVYDYKAIPALIEMTETLNTTIKKITPSKEVREAIKKLFVDANNLNIKAIKHQHKKGTAYSNKLYR